MFPSRKSLPTPLSPPRHSIGENGRSEDVSAYGCLILSPAPGPAPVRGFLREAQGSKTES